jgi:hypothetical protein
MEVELFVDDVDEELLCPVCTNVILLIRLSIRTLRTPRTLINSICNALLFRNVTTVVALGLIESEELQGRAHLLPNLHRRMAENKCDM